LNRKPTDLLKTILATWIERETRRADAKKVFAER
jgi:hypothetical protein